MKSNTFTKKLNKKIVFIAVIIFFIIVALAFFLFKKLSWREYRNDDLDFSFRYPKEWGEVKIDKSMNADLGNGKRLAGENLWLSFLGHDNQAMMMRAYTPDWQPWEHQIISWQKDQSAQQYCTSFLQYWFVLAHDDCKGDDTIATVDYVNYSGEGIASDPDTVSYYRVGFVRLHNKKFAGLELMQQLGKKVSSDFSSQPIDEFRSDEKQSLRSIIASEKKLIDQFNVILSSFRIQ